MRNRWFVEKCRCWPTGCRLWVAYSQGIGTRRDFPTHAEAIAYAHQQATKETRP